jgi:hypothetical protein
MSRPLPSRSLRAGLAVAAASAAALGAPALASANSASPVIHVNHSFEAPAIDGNLGEWSPDEVAGLARALPEFEVDKAIVSARYDCRAGRLNLSLAALDGVTFSDDPASHGLTYRVVGSKKPRVITGASPGVDFALAPDATAWEISLPLGDGRRYDGIGSTAFNEGDTPGVAEFSAIVPISCPTLRVDKTADGERDLLYDWAVQKTVTAPEQITEGATTVDVDYTVTATKLDPEVINRRLSGTITAHNPEGNIPVPDVVLKEKGTDIGADCRIVSASKTTSKGEIAVPVKRATTHVAVGTLEPGRSAVARYVCSYTPTGEPVAGGTNYGAVKWPGPGKGRYAVDRAAFTFDAVANRYRDTVTLVDQFHNDPADTEEISDTSIRTTTRRLTVPAGGEECETSITYTNTASLFDGTPDWGPTSSVSTVVCSDGQVVATKGIPAPAVAATRPGRKLGLRASIRGPKRIRQGQRLRYRVRIANRAKQGARRVVSRFTVPRGMKVVRVLRAPRHAVVRGRTVRMRFDGIGKARTRTVVVVVKAHRRARLGSGRMVVRAKAANLKGTKPARAAKRVRIVRGL